MITIDDTAQARERCAVFDSEVQGAYISTCRGAASRILPSSSSRRETLQRGSPTYRIRESEDVAAYCPSEACCVAKPSDPRRTFCSSRWSPSLRPAPAKSGDDPAGFAAATSLLARTMTAPDLPRCARPHDVWCRRCALLPLTVAS